MTTEDPLFLLFLIALLLVALLYSSVGHGGASGYLALMAIFSFSPESIRPTALLLNLFVAGIAFFHYFRAGYFRGNLFLSFALSSVPLAFLGGMFTIDGGVYKKLLGLLLVFAVVKIVYDFPREEKEIRKVKFCVSQNPKILQDRKLSVWLFLCFKRENNVKKVGRSPR